MNVTDIIATANRIQAMSMEHANDILVRAEMEMNAEQPAGILAPGRQSMFCFSPSVVRELVLAWKALNREAI